MMNRVVLAFVDTIIMIVMLLVDVFVAAVETTVLILSDLLS